MNGANAGRHEMVYHWLLWLYPGDLRADHGQEMAQVFHDLVRERGRRIWGLIALDLAVSVPRTRLESIMNKTVDHRTVTATIFLVGLLLSVLALMLFGTVGLPIPIVVATLALTQRSRFARVLESSEGQRRGRTPLLVFVVSAAIFCGTVATWLVATGRGYGFSDATLLVYNLLGIGSLVGVVVSGVMLASRRRASSTPA